MHPAPKALTSKATRESSEAHEIQGGFRSEDPSDSSVHQRLQAISQQGPQRPTGKKRDFSINRELSGSLAGQCIRMALLLLK